ncbi:MAG: ABC transporter substrate-binding protein [Candidatus Thorarchaeota archaeon]|jgi:ABC-type Fe3+ transport system substrate-binding protein
MASEFETGRNMKTIIIAVVVIGVIGVAAVVLVLNQPPPGEEGKTLTILTRHDTAIHTAYEPAFLATQFAIDNNIVDILWKTQAANFWDDVIEAGGVDVLWGGGPTLFDQMNRDGYLSPMTSPLMEEVLARVPDEVAGADMKRVNGDGDVVWVAAAISSFGFTVNTAFLSENSLPTPNNWTHLASPIWGSLLPTQTIAMGNAPKTTSNTRIYEIITQGMGWDNGWITMARMAGSARLYQGSVETQAASENKDVGVSMSIDFYGFSTQIRNPECRYILPEGESIVNGDPIAIVPTTTQRDLAEGFIDYVLTPEGQAVWFTQGVNRMPVLDSAFDVDIGIDTTELENFYIQTLANQGIDFNDSLSLATSTAFTAYFEAVFNDPHDDLQAAWQDIVREYYNGNITLDELDQLAAIMGTPVTAMIDGSLQKFTVDLALQINNDMIYDTSFYYASQTAWTTAATAQYAAALAQLDVLLND